MKPGDKGFVRIWKATGYTWAGLKAAWRHEAAFRQEVALAAFLTPAAILLGRSPVEQALLIGVALMVLVVELLNSAIEAAIDRIGHDAHYLSGIAKDMGSAAVFISLCIVALVWGAVILDQAVG